MSSDLLPGADYAGSVIEGKFTLLRWLGGTGHSSVFLTELLGDSPRQAAIKFVPAGDTRNAQWEAASNQSHPDLIRVFALGRTDLDGKKLDYILTEYAEEVLAEILAERPLSAEETAEMLPPIVAALESLHSQGLVHGNLTPTNILAAGDRLKLSVDGIEAAGGPGRRLHPLSDYDAPEMATENMAPAMDVWSLGVVLVKVLTQQMPEWNGSGGAEPMVPSSVPEPFASIARDCLRVDPARRCTLRDIRVRLGLVSNEAPDPRPVFKPARVSAPAPVSFPAAAPVREPVNPATRTVRSRVPLMVAALVMLLAIVIAATWMNRSRRTQASPETPTPNPGAASPAPDEKRQVAARPARDSSAASGAVVHRVMPEVPKPAMATIRGHVRVGVRVQVDASGDVTNAMLEWQGPSRYFANFALDAARGWKFRPAEPGAWVLQFVFTRDGVEVNPVQMRR